jgi:predicted nicotinamide N-methyase
LTPQEGSDFIAANTRAGTHPLVPEIRIHLATEITPIWQASEDSLDASGVEPPFWAFAWPGGVATARYLLDQPQIAQGRVVLDIAAGCGIAAIAAARAGAERVLAADIDPLARAAITLNAALNGLGVEIARDDLLAAPPPEADLILAGDVFYERALAAKILPWLDAARARGAEVLIADPGRAYLPKDRLEPLTRYHVATTMELEDREMRETVIYRLRA